MVWAAVAACAAFWVSRLWVTAPPLPPGSRTLAATQALRGDLSRLFGVPAVEAAPAPALAAAAPPSRYRLLGLARPPQAAGEALALIAVDDRPAKAYRVGARVDGDLVLQRVLASSAELGARGSGAATISLPLSTPSAAVAGPTAVAPVFAPPRPPAMRVRPGGLPSALPVGPGVEAADGGDEAQADGEPEAPPAPPAPRVPGASMTTQ